jgi:hypothetical protein
MKILSFLLVLSFVVGMPALAGSADRDLPGIGTFAYNSVPVQVPQRMAALGLPRPGSAPGG